jgi:glycosyltransferase involved in cell wall biosynthesis
MTATPRVSIVIPTYNREKLLVRAIESVQVQTYPDWELIVVDDRSTDCTREWVENFARQDARIQYRVNTHRQGPAGARNEGLEHIRGERIAFLDSDDRWEPEKLAAQTTYLDQQPSVDAVGVDLRMIDANSDQERTIKSFLLEMIEYWAQDEPSRAVIPCRRLRDDISRITDREVFLNLIIGGFGWLHTSAIMINRRVFERVGGFDERLERTEDLRLWLAINREFRLGYIDECLGTHDITGREHTTGFRYKTYSPNRRHTHDLEFSYHVRLYHHIRRMHHLDKAQKRLVRWKLRNMHRMHAFRLKQQRPLRSAFHYACTFFYRPKDLLFLLTCPRNFLSSPH